MFIKIVPFILQKSMIYLTNRKKCPETTGTIQIDWHAWYKSFILYCFVDAYMFNGEKVNSATPFSLQSSLYGLWMVYI